MPQHLLNCSYQLLDLNGTLMQCSYCWLHPAPCFIKRPSITSIQCIPVSLSSVQLEHEEVKVSEQVNLCSLLSVEMLTFALPWAWRGQVYPLSSISPVLDCPQNMLCHTLECILCKECREVCFENNIINFQNVLPCLAILAEMINPSLPSIY